MRFAFTEDQLALRDAVRDLLERECTPTHVRAAWANATGRVPGLWAHLEAMGVPALLVPEADGGLGFTMADLVLVLEETGRHALPEPIVETAAFGAPVVGAGLTVAAAHALVPWADTADVILTSAGRFDPAAVELVPHPSVDGARRVFEVRGEAEPFPGDLHAAYIRGICGNAAQLCGLSDRMLAMTADYVKDREQFGVPVGSFQAVKHHLANARVALEFTRPLVYRAACTLDGIHVHMAMAKAADTAIATARAALQCHGAIGYTTEHDLHLYMKRAWALARAWGDARVHRERVAKAIL
ncbi:MAG: acyl-CoA dehydrogenase family protein [Actinomycetota bacterium]